MTEKDATLQDKSNKLGAYVLVSPSSENKISADGIGPRQTSRR